MSMVVEIRPEAGILRVIAAGKFSLKEAGRTFLQILEAALLHKTSAVLFDGRQLLGKPATMERFYYGDFAARSVANFGNDGELRPTRFAYVLREPVLDPGRFGETVAVNRGMYVKAFDNPEEALQWLGIAPASNPGACDADCGA